jgi:PAS domain S-box-containing protein
MMVVPVLVIGIGLLLGTRGAFACACASIVLTTVFYRLSPALRNTGFTSQAIYWLVLYAIALFSAWALLTLSLSGFDRVYKEMVAKEQDLADTIRFAPDGILVLDAESRVRLANPAAEAVLDITAERLIGRTVDDVLHEAARGSALPTTIPRDFGDAPISMQFETREGAPVHVEATWRRMEGDRRQLLLRNTSERMRAEQERREMEIQLAHAQRLEAVGQLAGGLSHDFNNILTVVGGSAELLRGSDHTPERAALIEEILAARDRGAALTHQLLAFARREVIQPRVVELSGLVRGVERLLERVAGDRQRLRFRLDADTRVRADAGQLEQALVNLVSNARDAMPNGGNCTITVERVALADGGARVRLHVADEGVGMTEEVSSRAFEPFFTTKPRGRGTGLGLSSVHATAVQNGGTAYITTAPGGGTRVTLDLPSCDEAVLAEGEATLAPRTRTGALTILVAEDDDAARHVVGRVLRRAGYEVVATTDGVEALTALAASPDRIDLVLTDVMMPRMTGPRLAARVRELYPRLPVLLMSGYAEEAIEELGELASDRPLVLKPFTSHELVSQIDEILQSVTSIEGSTRDPVAT